MKLDEAQRNAEQALALLTSEQADEIIGSPQPDEYKTLLAGMTGIYNMLWTMAVNSGMKQKGAALRMGSQAMTVMLTLVHYAYALGIRRGREGR